jgi:hypothetical protein
MAERSKYNIHEAELLSLIRKRLIQLLIAMASSTHAIAESGQRVR